MFVCLPLGITEIVMQIFFEPTTEHFLTYILIFPPMVYLVIDLTSDNFEERKKNLELRKSLNQAYNKIHRLESTKP